METSKKDNLIITDINRIIFVGKNEYTENHIKFSKNKLFYHELIYHISGESTVHFNNETLHTAPNTIRYLPMGDCQRYEVEKKRSRRMY